MILGDCCDRSRSSAGLASAEEVAAAIESLAAFTAAPDTVVSGARIFQVWARR